MDTSWFFGHDFFLRKKTADCRTIMLVFHRVPNVQDGGRKPEVPTTLPVTDTDVVPKLKWHKCHIANQVAYT